MIIKANFNNGRKAEKAAALLALNVDKGAKYGRCLNSEEMAALVDARCAKEELAVYLRHLSGCEKCYREWLALKTMDNTKIGSAARDRRHPVSRIKKYGFIGSALAVAASVVVFLNLNHLPHMIEDGSSPEAVLEESQKSPAVQQLNRQADTLGSAKTIAPIEKESSRKMKGLSVPVPQPAAPAAKKMERAELSGAGSEHLDFDSWLDTLQKNCLSGMQDKEFWTKMTMQGRNILNEQADSLPKDKVETVTAALALLNGMGTNPVNDQCRQLVALLAEREKSR